MIKIKTGFSELDKIIDISKPQLILLTGATLADILSGDIANNICLKQECEVLEIIHTRKEYLIQIANALCDKISLKGKDKWKTTRFLERKV